MLIENLRTPELWTAPQRSKPCIIGAWTALLPMWRLLFLLAGRVRAWGLTRRL